MTPSLDTWAPQSRRTLLQLLGAVAGTGVLQQALAQEDDGDGRTVVLEQGDRCVELTPHSGDAPVEELYDYTYQENIFDGPPGSQGMTYSSMGTTDLQRDRTSILFLYDGPEGLSLVVVHGRVDGDDDGGTVTFTLGGVPADATWIVRDDYYLEDGEQAPSNFDRWDVDGTIHVVDWTYKGGQTDGGALRGLGSEFEIIVDPAFNDEAALAEERSHYGPVEAWEALSGDHEDPERFPLRLDQHLHIRTGTCGDATGAHAPDERETASDGESDPEETTDDETADEIDEPSTDDESSDDETVEQERSGDGGTDDGETDDGESRERRRTKHERKQEKHQRKHERKQRKHAEKHRKKQRKHQRKHERKQRKHERKQRTEDD